ncbi:MAG: hypothetical protein BWY71_01610 [Planctomycetes bacterium ADurb.Bin412]|nr:MAG: hypothetical protein BWY71_01610 [Planctomycetes bacterium ADurb.Bin412]
MASPGRVEIFNLLISFLHLFLKIPSGIFIPAPPAGVLMIFPIPDIGPAVSAHRINRFSEIPGNPQQQTLDLPRIKMSRKLLHQRFHPLPQMRIPDTLGTGLLIMFQTAGKNRFLALLKPAGRRISRPRNQKGNPADPLLLIQVHLHIIKGKIPPVFFRLQQHPFHIRLKSSYFGGFGAAGDFLYLAPGLF